ncbi:unnamed protein product [Alopecurus aequalis]
MLAPILRHEDGGTVRLSVHDVKTILHVLRPKDDISALSTQEETVGPVVERTTSCADLGDGRIAYTTVTIVQRAGDHIASLHHPRDMESSLSSYSTQAAPPVPEPGKAKWPPQDTPCAFVQFFNANTDSCAYLRSLEMSLYGAIHGFYLRALAMLPSHTARQHIRGVLLAGHCYGPMDPVSNIVLSAIWYDVHFPLPYFDRRTQAHDILDTLSLLRSVSRSMRGLVALLHATSGQKLPLHDILKYLGYSQCNLSAALKPHLHHDGSSPNPFASATAASRHPQASAMASFFVSLTPTKLDQLRSLITSATANNALRESRSVPDAPLSQESLTQVYNILREETVILWQPRPPKLCDTALSILAGKRESYNYEQLQSYIRGMVEQLLLEYVHAHPSEPKYDLDFICGVDITGYSQYGQCYHVNFMASTKSSLRNTLFFAEFSWAYNNQPKKSVCCPLPQTYDMGRCYYGRESAHKIVYLDHSVDYFLSDITTSGLDDTEGRLDTDFLYFDSKRDVELAKELQRMAKKQEVMQRSSVGMISQWTTHRGC